MESSRPLPSSLILIGAGNMGAAMIEGWLEVGISGPGTTILDPQPSFEIQALCAKSKIALNPPIRDIKPPQAVVLAIKPQTLDAAGAVIDRLIGKETLLISILAGKKIVDLTRQIPQAHAVVRAMPNLAAAVRLSATAAFANEDVTDRQRAMAHALLAGIGTVEWVDREKLIDAVTAVSGSGPAYVFYLTECLAHAGSQAGLPLELAERLARATVIGAGELLKQQEDMPPGKLRHNVTSPGGTTAAALEILMKEPGLRELMREAVAAAKRRAEALSG